MFRVGSAGDLRAPNRSVVSSHVPARHRRCHRVGGTPRTRRLQRSRRADLPPGPGSDPGAPSRRCPDRVAARPSPPSPRCRSSRARSKPPRSRTPWPRTPPRCSRSAPPISARPAAASSPRSAISTWPTPPPCGRRTRPTRTRPDRLNRAGRPQPSPSTSHSAKKPGFTKAVDQLLAAESKAAVAHRARALTTEGLASLLWGSLAVSSTHLAAILRGADLAGDSPDPTVATVAAPRARAPMPLVPVVEAEQEMVRQLHAIVYGYQLALGRLDRSPSRHGGR